MRGKFREEAVVPRSHSCLVENEYLEQAAELAQIFRIRVTCIYWLDHLHLFLFRLYMWA